MTKSNVLETSGIPDPLQNSGMLFVYPELLPYHDLHPKHPDTLHIRIKYGHYKNGECIDSDVVHINKTKLETESWDSFVELVNLCVSNTGSNTKIISIHNIGFLQRAAWWWSRRLKLPDPIWNSSNSNIDIVNVYNGPAILTAEERFSFNINMACRSLGKSVTEFPGSIDDQYDNFLWLWKQLRI